MNELRVEQFAASAQCRAGQMDGSLLMFCNRAMWAGPDALSCCHTLRAVLAALCLCGTTGCGTPSPYGAGRPGLLPFSSEPWDTENESLADDILDRSDDVKVLVGRLQKLDEQRSWMSVRTSCNVISQILVSASSSYDERLDALDAQSLRTPVGYDVLRAIKRDGTLVTAGTCVIQDAGGQELFRYDASASEMWMKKAFDATLEEASYAANEYRSLMLAMARYVTGCIGDPRQEIAIALLHFTSASRADFYFHPTDGQPVDILWDNVSVEMGRLRIVIPSECSAEDERNLGLYLDVFDLGQQLKLSSRKVEPRLAFRLGREDWMMLKALFSAIECRWSRRMIDH